MKHRDINSAIGSLKLEGLTPSDKIINKLYREVISNSAKNGTLKHIAVQYTEYLDSISIVIA